STVETVIGWFDEREPPASAALRAGAKARLEAARGRMKATIALFRRAIHPDDGDVGGSAPLNDMIGLIEALLADGQVDEARRALDAEQAWQGAAASIEEWRASIPAARLRGGLLGLHRHALESRLDSLGGRGDAPEAFRVSEQILGRELLDRTRLREAGASTAA